MSGRSAKVKGYRVERELVHKHGDAGIPCKRVPLSGAQEGYKGDLRIGERFVAEVKARKSGAGFVTLERWLGDNDLLFLRRNHAEPMVVMPWRVYVPMMVAYRSSAGHLRSVLDDEQPPAALLRALECAEEAFAEPETEEAT